MLSGQAWKQFIAICRISLNHAVARFHVCAEAPAALFRVCDKPRSMARTANPMWPRFPGAARFLYDIIERREGLPDCAMPDERSRDRCDISSTITATVITASAIALTMSPAK